MMNCTNPTPAMSEQDRYETTSSGSRTIAALASKYAPIPLTDTELGWILVKPKEQWPDGLAAKVEALLNPPP
jgi:hypothetical protein